MSRIVVQLLGGVDVYDSDGRRLQLPSRNGAGLLACLCVGRDRMRSRAKLATLLWDLWDAEHARGSLRQTLFLLRRTLGEGVLHCQGDIVGLDTARIACDVLEFEALIARGTPESLMRAAQLYHGEFMDGHPIGKGFAFEDWLSAERNRLRDAALFATGRALDHAILRNDRDAARWAASRMVAIDRTEETAHRALMNIYAGERRFCLALRQYDLCRRALESELGVEPDAETRALHAEIVRYRSVRTRAKPVPRIPEQPPLSQVA